MNIPFNFSEFIITDEKPVAREIYDKIMRYHIGAVLGFRIRSGRPMWPSQNSCYRPKWYELQQGRPGTSQHTFEDNPETGAVGRGACDWTTNTTLVAFADLGEFLTSPECSYTRICYYPSSLFFHCDYKIGSGKQFFINTPDGWELTSRNQLLQAINETGSLRT